MKRSLYSNLQKKIVFVTLLASFTPLLVLGLTIYYQFEETLREKIAEQIKYRATAQAEAVDLFLKERTAILAAMADTHSFAEIIRERTLERIFEVMNARAGAFVDLGVIDSAGQHREYIGPYDLQGLNYYNQDWFAETMAKGLYISDVYLGFRRSPHFIIAVRRQEKQQSWILRATIDPNIFGGIVRSAQIGRTGDAFIINAKGEYQTAPRFDGEILSPADMNPSLFGGGTTVVERRSVNGRGRLYAGCWLKGNRWLLVISQEAEEEMHRLFATRDVELFIIAGGLIAIVMLTVFTTRTTVNRLKATDARLNELNAQLVQSDKLAALGKMAAGVAHEINNPLAVIIQKTGWMEDLLEDEAFKNSQNIDEFRSSIQKIEEHVERARKVVHNMLGYARKMEPHLEDVDVNAVLKQTVSLLDNYARINNIEIRKDLAPDLPIIASDQAQLQQVFLNLITNAIDAIGQQGLIQIQTKVADANIQVNITDSGPGMSEDQKRKIFDPFFTTKEPGKGTGLGLWVSYNIIEKMGGTITFCSRIGQGTTFTVQIPVVVPEKK